MQRTNALLLVTVLIGLAIMTLWRLTAEEIRPLDPSDPVSDSGEGVASGDSGGAGDAGGGSQPLVELAPGAPRVVVRVTARERYVLPDPSPVRAVLLPRRDPLPTTLLAGTGAEPWAGAQAERAPRAGAALVRVAIDGSFLVRQAVVDPAVGTAELLIGSELRITGTIRDATRQPVQDARVWLGQLESDGRTRHVRTDGEGRFEVSVRAGPGVPFVAWAEGHAAAWRAVTIGVDLDRDLEITLPAGGELTVQLAGQAVEVQRGQAFVTPAAAISAELASYPFFLQGLVGGIEFDARGRGRGTFLPQNGNVGVTLVHPLLAIGRNKEVELGEREQCVVPVDFRPAWRTRVTDSGGVAVPAVEALLRPEGRRPAVVSRQRLLPPHVGAAGCYYAKADPDGALLIARPSAGDVLALRAPGFAGRDVVIRDALPEPITLHAWDGTEPALALQPPVTGRDWRAEFSLGEGVTIDLPAGEAAIVALPHAGRFAVEMITFVGEEERGREDLGEIVATGRTALQAPRIE